MFEYVKGIEANDYAELVQKQHLEPLQVSGRPQVAPSLMAPAGVR